jgi:hypothetical protein
MAMGVREFLKNRVIDLGYYHKCELGDECPFPKCAENGASKLRDIRKLYCEENYYMFCARYIMHKQLGHVPENLLPDQQYLIPLIVSREDA